MARINVDTSGFWGFALLAAVVAGYLALTTLVKHLYIRRCGRLT